MEDTIEKIYDKYCNLLYSIAISIFQSEQLAGGIFSETFIQFYKQNLITVQNPSHCVKLIKLLFAISREKHHSLGGEVEYRLELIKESPFLYKLFCDEAKNIETHYCENNSSQTGISATKQQEFRHLLHNHTLSSNSIHFSYQD